MKIRLYKDSLRLRVSPSETDKLTAGEVIKETFFWNKDHSLVFELIPDGSNKLDAVDHDNRWQICWSKDEIKKWSSSDDVGMYQTFEIDDNQHIKVAIEKDFACTGREGEDKKDRYPNPKDNC